MKAKRTQKKQIFPPIVIDNRNLVLFLAGVVTLIIGFILLSIAPWDNPISRIIAPLVLLLAYLVIFPAAIFIGSIKKKKALQEKLSES